MMKNESHPDFVPSSRYEMLELVIKTMPTPSKRPRTAKPQQNHRKYRPDPPNSLYGTKTFESVDPRWIIKALAITLAAAMLCAYLLLCAVFWRNQWQLVLQPSRNVVATPATDNLSYTEIRFGDDATGQPQLDGWWIPSQTSPQNAAQPTALLLHAGHGSVSDALPAALSLHQAGLNVLLFDYRGFGRSGGRHPSQALMQTDSASALRYLTDMRHIHTSQIVVYGTGVGASLAVRLCARHKDLAALILEAAEGDLKSRIAHDPRTSLIPVSLLFHNSFPLAVPLHTLPTPKLLIYTNSSKPPKSFQQAADPKITIELASPQDTNTLQQAFQRFLGTYIYQ